MASAREGQGGMSKFKVGDRVRYDGLFNGTNSGTVTRVEGATASVQWDDGICLVYGVGRLLPLGSATTFKVGDRVVCTCGQAECVGSDVVISVHDTGANVKWDASANETSWPLHRMRLVAPAPPVAVAPMAIGDLVHPSGAKMEAGPAFRITYSAPVWGDSRDIIDQLTAAEVNELLKARADLLAARDEHRAMRAALDTVRRFLGSHSFASCSLACNRELREVMAVVLAALDADKAAK